MVAAQNSSTQLLIRFGYAGQRFHGLQPQPQRATAGAALLQRVEAATGLVPYAVSFAARTDKGVHALANIATCRVRGAPPTDWRDLLAAHRDDGLQEVAGGVLPHRAMARALATSKVYSYAIDTGSDAASSEQAWHIPVPLDVAAMEQAATHLLGTHNFAAFADASCGAKNPVKTVTRAVLQRRGSQLLVTLEGSGFLRKMVRIIVGTLAEVGCGLRRPDSIAATRSSGDRRNAGVTAPAGGLTLVRIACSVDVDATLAPCHRGPLPLPLPISPSSCAPNIA